MRHHRFSYHNFSKIFMTFQGLRSDSQFQGGILFNTKLPTESWKWAVFTFQMARVLDRNHTICDVEFFKSFIWSKSKNFRFHIENILKSSNAGGGEREVKKERRERVCVLTYLPHLERIPGPPTQSLSCPLPSSPLNNGEGSKTYPHKWLCSHKGEPLMGVLGCAVGKGEYEAGRMGPGSLIFCGMFFRRVFFWTAERKGSKKSHHEQVFFWFLCAPTIVNEKRERDNGPHLLLWNDFILTFLRGPDLRRTKRIPRPPPSWRSLRSANKYSVRIIRIFICIFLGGFGYYFLLRKQKPNKKTCTWLTTKVPHWSKFSGERSIHSAPTFPVFS